MTSPSAILTGDLIASTRAGAAGVDRAMAALAGAADAIAEWQAASARFTRFRGDGWQIRLTRPGLVLRASLYLAASLRATDAGLATRIAAGIGGVDHAGSHDLSDASGTAFAVSGRALDAMARTRRLALAGDPAPPSWQVAVFQLADWQSARWSAAQAEAVVLAPAPGAGPRSDLAAGLGITRQALQARLNGAGLDALEGVLAAFEAGDGQGAAQGDGR